LYFYGLDINIKRKSLSNGNTGWAKLDASGAIVVNLNFNIKNLGEAIANDLLKGHKVALGFEAPMWYPIPKYDAQGRFHMTPRFKEEETSIQKRNGNYESSKRWYVGGSQPMVKGYPLGLLLFEWMIQEYANNSTGDHLLTIKATTDFKLWADKESEHQLYLYEGFVTGLYKPEKGDFKKIKDKGVLTNNEVADAFIVAEAARVFNSGLIKLSVDFPKDAITLRPHSMSFDNHLRVCIDANTGQVNSYITKPNNIPSKDPKPYIPTKPLKVPTRFMSVWRHVIDDANESSKQVGIEITGKKACDVYGFKFR